MPFSAPLPVPTIIATGVAKPKAHGQDITNTETPKLTASSISLVTKYQMVRVNKDKTITIGTKTEETLSASKAKRALEEEASSTRLIILAKVVSFPTEDTLNRKKPF
ncbi:hypothetical protein SDC9_132698 [bioreactor metagenome]|uniref:Uncharacterized protein n=1 Tax=bioreactor metagenome TaxID=1076179 RepID=A0A645D8T4_9ZZZZ